MEPYSKLMDFDLASWTRKSNLSSRKLQVALYSCVYGITFFAMGPGRAVNGLNKNNDLWSVINLTDWVWERG